MFKFKGWRPSVCHVANKALCPHPHYRGGFDPLTLGWFCIIAHSYTPFFKRPDQCLWSALWSGRHRHTAGCGSAQGRGGCRGTAFATASCCATCLARPTTTGPPWTSAAPDAGVEGDAAVARTDPRGVRFVRNPRERTLREAGSRRQGRAAKAGRAQPTSAAGRGAGKRPGGGSVESLRGPGSSQGPARRLWQEAGGSGRVSAPMTEWYSGTPPLLPPTPVSATASRCWGCAAAAAASVSPQGSSLPAPPLSPSPSPPTFTPWLSSFTGIGFKWRHRFIFTPMTSSQQLEVYWPAKLFSLARSPPCVCLLCPLVCDRLGPSGNQRLFFFFKKKQPTNQHTQLP